MKRFNVAVVGCGGMADGWLQYAIKREDVEIKLLVDLNLDNAKRRREDYKLDCEVASELNEEIIKKLGVNLVFDVTIPDAHYSVVTTALNAGCDVFGEKPMSSSIENARKMVALAKEKGKTYAVMQNYRYTKEIRAYKELLSPDVIGTMGTLQQDFYLDPQFDGFRAEMESPLILDMAIHSFDMARFLSGANAVSVYCHEYNPKWSYYKGDIAAVVIFEMDNGAVFTYNGSWAAPGCGTGWNGHWRAVGEKGSATWDGGGNARAEAMVDGEMKEVLPQYTWDASTQHHAGCFNAMFDALINGYDTETVCTDNIKSIEMVFAAIESSRTGKKVMLNQF